MLVPQWNRLLTGGASLDDAQPCRCGHVAGMKTDNSKSNSGAVSPTEVLDRREFIARTEACLDQAPGHAVNLALERLRLYPDDMEARIVLGIGWYRKGERAPALEILMGIAEDVIRWSPVFGILSELCREGGLDDAAGQASRIYISLNPESPEAIANLEERLRRETLSCPKFGAETLEEETGLPRGTDFKTLTLADLYARQGYRELAEALLKEILASDPRNQDALERLRKIRPQTKEETGPSTPDEGLPILPSLKGLFSHAMEVQRIEPDHAVPVVLCPGNGPESEAPDPREAIIETLNRWLVSIDRMKTNA